jgi:hypothetical protein
MNWLFRYPVGTALAAWRYLWRPLPLHFVDADVTDVEMPPVPLTAPDIQHAEDGTGPLFHRRYRIRLRHSPLGPAELMRAVVDDLHSLSPREVAAFHRQSGRPGELEVGDDYLVRLPGPRRASCSRPAAGTPRPASSGSGRAGSGTTWGSRSSPGRGAAGGGRISSTTGWGWPG